MEFQDKNGERNESSQNKKACKNHWKANRKVTAWLSWFFFLILAPFSNQGKYIGNRRQCSGSYYRKTMDYSSDKQRKKARHLEKSYKINKLMRSLKDLRI